jgi:HD domain
LNPARTEEEAVAAEDISGVRIPDSKLAREVTQRIRDAEGDLLFYHSTRVYFWGALIAKRKDLIFDPELLYTAAMFHDIGLTQSYRGSQLRFEVDGANAARDFLRGHGISESGIDKVWTAIALHTTPGIPEHMHPEIALVQAGAGMDVVGRGYEHFTHAQREAVIAAYPRGPLGHKDVRGRPLLAVQAPQGAYLVALHRVNTRRAVLRPADV